MLFRSPAKKKKKKEERKEQNLPSFPHQSCLHFLPKADLMGGTPGLPPDPGNQVTGRPGAEKGEGMGEGEGPPRSAFLGAPSTPPSCSRPGPTVSRARVPLPFGFPGLSDSPESLPCPGCPRLSSRCWEASLDPGHFSLAVF